MLKSSPLRDAQEAWCALLDSSWWGITASWGHPAGSDSFTMVVCPLEQCPQGRRWQCIAGVPSRGLRPPMKTPQRGVVLMVTGCGEAGEEGGAKAAGMGWPGPRGVHRALIKCVPCMPACA